MMNFNYCCVCRGPIGITQPGPRGDRERFVPRKEEEWTNFCRAIYKPAKGDDGYRVSGICYYHNTTTNAAYEVPIRRSAAKTRSRTRVGKRIRFNCVCIPGQKCGRKPHCYQVHSYCWSWTEKLFGPFSSDDLELLVRALEDRWESPQTPHPASCCDLCVGVLRANQIEISDRQRFATVCNPDKIPALRKVLRLHNSTKTKKHKPPHPVKLKWSGSGPLRIPLELQLLIIDSLDDLRDIGNAVTAFQWKLPESYWKSRIPLNLFYEFKHLSSDELEWERLFVELGQFLVEMPWGLENRQRILRLIYLIRNSFSRIVEENRRKSRGFIEAAEVES